MATPSDDLGAAAPLWAAGRFTLRVRGAGGDDRLVTVDRPFGLIGRVATTDVPIENHAVSARHAYLHLDTRGLFVVDLATRTGTRVGDRGRSAGWLGPGEALEIAGLRIEVAALELAPGPADGTPPPLDGEADPLAERPDAALVHVTLYPAGSPDAPLAMNSELVFVGRSSACGVRVDDPAAGRLQCVLVRTPAGAYVVDLVGRGTTLAGRPVRGGARLADGDTLAIGSARFECRVQPAGPRWQPPAVREPARPLGSAPAIAAEILPPAPVLPTLPPGLLPDENQAALLAWMVGLFQAGQGELLRRQAQFQQDLTSVLREIQRDNAEALTKHLDRVEALHRELSGLRDEVRHSFGPTAAPARPPAPSVPKPPPLKINSSVPPQDPEAAAAWLLNRVNQLDQESRSTWRDLIGKLGKKSP